MALVNCPDCGKRMSTLESSCPQCGRRSAPPGVETPRAAAAPATPEPPAPDDEGWLIARARLSSGLLLGGFLFPLLVPNSEGTQAIWPWSLFSILKGPQVLGLLITPLLGVAALAASRMISGMRLAGVLASMAGAAWILSSLLRHGVEGGLLSMRSAGSVVMLILMPVSAGAIAVGNRLRKAHPREPLPRRLATAGGIALILCFLIPVDGDSPAIAAFFQSVGWRAAGPLLVVFLGLLGYGALGAFSLLRLRDEASYTRLVSILARAILWGAPISLTLNIGRLLGAWTLGAGIAIKTFAPWYGYLILLAASGAAWLEFRMAARVRRPPTASPGTRARPASPPAGPART